jgi:hypothetical protein
MEQTLARLNSPRSGLCYNNNKNERQSRFVVFFLCRFLLVKIGLMCIHIRVIIVIFPWSFAFMHKTLLLVVVAVIAVTSYVDAWTLPSPSITEPSPGVLATVYDGVNYPSVNSSDATRVAGKLYNFGATGNFSTDHPSTDRTIVMMVNGMVVCTTEDMSFMTNGFDAIHDWTISGKILLKSLVVVDPLTDTGTAEFQCYGGSWNIICEPYDEVWIPTMFSTGVAVSYSGPLTLNFDIQQTSIATTTLDTSYLY